MGKADQEEEAGGNGTRDSSKRGPASRASAATQASSRQSGLSASQATRTTAATTRADAIHAGRRHAEGACGPGELATQLCYLLPRAP